MSVSADMSVIYEGSSFLELHTNTTDTMTEVSEVPHTSVERWGAGVEYHFQEIS